MGNITYGNWSFIKVIPLDVSPVLKSFVVPKPSGCNLKNGKFLKAIGGKLVCG